tara:strand:+ start:649 stop:2937 length:2289 start_codon:yes stop_codon:yes gene_type:complete
MSRKRWDQAETQQERDASANRLQGLRRRKLETRYSKQNASYVKAFFKFLAGTGRYPNVVIDGARQWQNVTVSQFEEFTCSPKLTKESLNNTGRVMLKRDSYSKYKTALFAAMRAEGYEPPTSLINGIKAHLDLIGRENAEDGELGKVKLEQGSPAWELIFFRTLCKFLLNRGLHKDIWALAVVLMTFILISRINRTFKIRLSHMKWGQDFFTVFYPRSKTDVMGVGLGSKSPKHLYANVDEPSLNIVFVLGLYLLTHDLNGDNLFSHAKQMGNEEEEYVEPETDIDMPPSEDTNSLMEYLRGKVFKLVKNDKNEGMYSKTDGSSYDVLDPFWDEFFKTHGINPLDITSHGIRKLAKSYASTGAMANTNTDAVEIRMCHASQKQMKTHSGMSGVHGTYSNWLAKPDQYIGRVMTLISIAKIASFCSSPPYFESLSVEDAILKTAFADLDTSMYKAMLTFFLSSVVYALKEKQFVPHCDHVIQSVIRKIPLTLNVKVCRGDKFYRGFSGVSGFTESHRQLMYRMMAIEDSIREFGTKVLEPTLEKVMGKYNFSQPGGITREQLAEELQVWATKIISQGQSATTTAADKSLDVTSFQLESLKTQFLWKKEYVPQRKLKTGKGSYRCLPYGYQLVNSGLRTMLELWDLGTNYLDPDSAQVTHQIRPLKRVEPDDFSHEKQRRRFSRLKKVMHILEKVVPDNTTLYTGYEKYIVPFLEKVIKSQTRKNKNVKVRRIQFMTWYLYLKAYRGPLVVLDVEALTESIADV